MGTIKSIFSGSTKTNVKANLDVAVESNKLTSNNKVNNQIKKNNGEVNFITNSGLTYAEAKEVATVAAKDVAKDVAFQTARNEAQKVSEEFTIKLFKEYENDAELLLKACSEASFNYNFVDAIRALTSSSNLETTEKIIMGVLANRIEKGNSASVNLITQKAIYAADKLSDAELSNLSAFAAIISVIPSRKDLSLDMLTDWQLNHFRIILENTNLENGENWIQALELLDLVKTSSLSSKNFETYVKGRFEEYFKDINEIDLSDLNQKLGNNQDYQNLKLWWDKNIITGTSLTKIGDVIAFIDHKRHLVFGNVQSIEDIINLK